MCLFVRVCVCLCVHVSLHSQAKEMERRMQELQSFTSEYRQVQARKANHLSDTEEGEQQQPPRAQRPADAA